MLQIHQLNTFSINFFLRFFRLVNFGLEREDISRYLWYTFHYHIFQTEYVACCVNYFLDRNQRQQVLGEVDLMKEEIANRPSEGRTN